MKPVKSVVLLAAGALALSACDMNKKNKQSTAVEPSSATTTTTTTTTDQGSGIADDAATTDAAAAGAGAATAVDAHDHSEDLKTSEGSGAVSPEAVSDENLSDDQNFEDDEITDEVEEQEAFPTSQGAGAGDDYEYVDESSSEPNDVRGGRDPRMVPRNNEVDNTSSEPDLER